ncbi:triple helix repeat-containing collagen [[Clostridium] sordellii]|uniref:pLS20_p028 family conjugation system transmembrane protein n=1 Tax=Paraclostridium sordellii TaxID=1505 RepID=UPI0005DCC6C9|nr:hypothetical protein [Paeniclostridium sordellii]CEN25511.1 triple helix repeat-containing collagen [[Clostridium] sordellii] [Paeniclostridium sordellii]
MSDAQVIETLKAFKDVLGISSIWASAFRTLMWYLNLGLSKVVDLLSNGLSEIYSVMNFFNSKYVNDFISKYIVVIFAFASLALAVLGWKIIVKKENDYNKIITNALVAVTIFVVLPWGMQQSESLVRAGVSLLNGNVSKSTKIFSTNITDLYVIDKNGWKSTNPQPKNYIKNEDSLSFLNITEQMDTGGIFSSTKLSDKGSKILKHKISDASGEYKLEELKSHLVYEDEGYYRYSWHPFFIFIELGTLALVLFFTCFKTAQLIQELGILKIIVQGTVLTDIETGQRNKKLIEKIKNTFIILYIIMLLLNMYLLFIDFITASNISKPIQLVMILASGILVIDGPNFIEEIFGIDAGLKSIGRTMMSMVAGAKGAQMLAGAIGKTAVVAGKASIGASKAIGKGALHTSAGIKGALDGFKESSDIGTDNNSKDSNSMFSPLSGMSNTNESQDDTGVTPLSGTSNTNESQGDTGVTPLSDKLNTNESQDDIGATPLSGISNTNELQGDTGVTPLSGISNTNELQGNTGATPLSGISNTNELQGDTGATPLSGISNTNELQDDIGATPLSGISNTNELQGNTGATSTKGSVGTTPLSGTLGATSTKGSVGTTPLPGTSGATPLNVLRTAPSGISGITLPRGSVGTTPSGISGVTLPRGSVGTTPSGISGVTLPRGSVGATPSSISGVTLPRGSVGTTPSSISGVTLPRGSVGATPSSILENIKPKDIYKPNKISLPKDIEIKPIEKEPATSSTIVDIAVSKYADMAQQIYNSDTVKGVRNTYNVSKNSVVALKKEKNNEKRD